ncbi:MAG: site-2 protease family protein, partial [Rhodothermales bacterium]|nr:site-2 protease family protein [Rhodothermales bacterium]
VVYALLGPRWHGRIARATVLLLLFSASVGLVMDLTPVLREAAVAYGYYQWVGLAGAGAWLIVAALLYFFIRKLFDDRQARTAALFGVIAASALALRVEAVAATVGYSGWFFWCLLIVLLIKVDHPPVTVTEPLTPRRKLLGVLALVLFVLCFSIKPVYLA